MIDVKELVADKVSKIWKIQANQAYCQSPPQAVSHVPERGIVFIGSSPRFLCQANGLSDHGNTGSARFYDLKAEYEAQTDYFEAFTDIAQKTHLRWGYLDLLYFVENNPLELNQVMMTENGRNFVRQQLLASKMLIDRLSKTLEPVIFVANGQLTWYFLGKDNTDKHRRNYGDTIPIGYQFDWNDTIGTYLLGQHPFFFTNMLNGPEPVDQGAYERLVWQINFVKDKMRIL